MNLVFKCVISVLLGVSLWGAVVPVEASQSLDRVVVIVNDVAITEKEVAERVAFQKRYQPKEHTFSRDDIVKNLLIEELILQAAQRNGMSLDSKEMNQMVEDIIRSQEVPPELANDKEKLKKQLIIQSIRQGIISNADMETTEEEITEQMHNLPNQFQHISPIRYHLETLLIPLKTTQSHSLIMRWKLFNIFTRWRRSHSLSSQQDESQGIEMARQQAEQAFSRAKQGLSFQQLAAAQKGKGLLKIEDIWRAADKLPAAYLNALAQLKPGEVAGPFQFYNGFHLIRLKEASGPTVMKARHLLLKLGKDDPEIIRQRLETIRQSCLRGDSDFQQQAEQYSEDPNTVFKGGDLGWILPGTLDRAFEESLEPLKPGQISPPFKTADGWHIIQLVQKEFLTKDHPEWKRYIARRLIAQRKGIESIENMQKELYASAHIQWIDLTLKPVKQEKS
jgi:peptidyl-prolyl cis-trans isomerase SurA